MVAVPQRSGNGFKILKIAIVVVVLLIVSVSLYAFRCQIGIAKCSDKELEPLILYRNFKQNTCFLLNYTAATASNSNGNVTEARTNNSLYLCVKNIDENNDL